MIDKPISIGVARSAQINGVSTGCCRRFVAATIYRAHSISNQHRAGHAAIKPIQSSTASRIRAVDFCRSPRLRVFRPLVRRCRRSQFAASEDEKRVDARPFHLTRGPLSAGCAAWTAVTRGGRAFTRDRAMDSTSAAVASDSGRAGPLPRGTRPVSTERIAGEIARESAATPVGEPHDC